jgi:hypothetical protein
VSALLPTQSFRDWQPLYADHRIATFRVRVSKDGKVPAIRRWQRVGLSGSRELAQKFAEAEALGFCPGRLSGLTILDVDTPDDRVLADALDRYGQTPIIVRSGSGNHQGWYRYNGEGRLIRRIEPDQPIDILGGGFVVAPPSRGAKGAYQFIQGGLDDLDRLPILRGIEIVSPPLSPISNPIEAITEGRRNVSLWRYCMRSAHFCDDFGSLLDDARTYSEALLTPLSDEEVVKTARSAWEITQAGKNQFGQTGAWLPQSTVNALISDPALFALIGWLKAANGPNAEFLVADGLCAPKYLGWPIGLLRKARRRAIDTGWIVKIRHEVKGVAALYRWGPAAKTAMHETLS